MLNLTTGRPVIERLVETGNLQSSPISAEMTSAILAEAADALTASSTLADNHPAIAYEVAHESLRKSLTAFLNVQGLRPSAAPGGHAAVVEAVTAQLRGPLGGLCREIDTIRVTRNSISYGGTAHTVTAVQAHNAIAVATDVHRGITKIIATGQVPLWR